MLEPFPSSLLRYLPDTYALRLQFNFTGVHRYLAFSNSPLPFDRSTVAWLLAAENVLNVSGRRLFADSRLQIVSWDVVPMQFVGRFLLIK